MVDRLTAETAEVDLVGGAFGASQGLDLIFPNQEVEAAVNAADDTDTFTIGALQPGGEYRVRIQNVDNPDGPFLAGFTFTEAEEGAASFKVFIDDVAPTALATGAAKANLAQPFELQLSDYVDPGQEAVLQVYVDWGDGTSRTLVENPNLSGPLKIIHTYGSLADHLVTISVGTAEGEFEVASLPVSVISPGFAINAANAIQPEGKPHRLVTDVDAPLEQQILDVPKRQRETDVHHDDEADHLWRGIEPPERIMGLVLAGHFAGLNSARCRLVHFA